MRSIHAIRWMENLINSNHQLYWFDILDRGEIPNLKNVHQITNWKQRKMTYIKGEHFLRKNTPSIYKKIQPYLEVTINEKLVQILNEIQPDIVHSFEMQSCSYPILETMHKFTKIKWLYNSWGNDIFYYQNIQSHKKQINQVLSRVNYMSADCKRDRILANQNGFKGEFLDVIPGGGGYDLTYFEKYKKPFEKRKIIIVKGYHHLFGRALNVVKALEEIKDDLQQFSVVVFGAHKVVEDYISNKKLPFQVYDRHGLKQDEVLKLMGQSAIYVGNNISDGMPNTLLEAMIMGAFPIQSNPGGATAEIIEDGNNGFLIHNPEDIEEIKKLILKAIQNQDWIKSATLENYSIAKAYVDLNANQQKIVVLYQQIENDTCE
jgi:glycosyltransferase involved in cell wall biosynthesis